MGYGRLAYKYIYIYVQYIYIYTHSSHQVPPSSNVQISRMCFFLRAIATRHRI